MPHYAFNDPGVFDLGHLDADGLSDLAVDMPAAGAAQDSIDLPYRFGLRAYQAPTWNALFREGKTRLACEWHRRAGKDRLAWNMMAAYASQVPGNYLYLLPTNVWARKVIWDGIGADGMRYIDHIPDSVADRQVVTMRFEMHQSGSIVQLAGCDNPDTWRGANPRGIVFSEWSHHNPMAYDVLRPVLAENGGWALFNWTPKGKNHGYQTRRRALAAPDEWFFSSLDVSQTERPDGSPVIAEEDIERERADGMSEAMILQEFWLSYDAPNPGAYYDLELRLARMEGRIRRVPIDTTLPVHTFWDLGFGDATAIWLAQFVGGEVRLILYVEDSGKAMPHYCKILNDWATERHIHWGRHMAPHDIEVTEYTTGVSRIEAARKHGFAFQVVPRWNQANGLDVAEGIEATRAILGRCVFDEEGTDHEGGRGLSALADFQRKWSEAEARYLDHPKENWAVHGADAFRMLACSYRPAWGVPAKRVRGQRRFKTEFDPTGGLFNASK